MSIIKYYVIFMEMLVIEWFSVALGLLCNMKGPHTYTNKTKNVEEMCCLVPLISLGIFYIVYSYSWMDRRLRRFMEGLAAAGHVQLLL